MSDPRRASAGPRPDAVCPACRTCYFGAVPGHCTWCGVEVEGPGGERLHRFACVTPDCPGRRLFGAGWLPELSLGCVWTCWSCGVRQVARVPMEDSAYLGFTEEDQRPEHQDHPG